jgi:malate:Na+ symporter
MLESAQAASWRDRTKLAGGALPVAFWPAGWWRLVDFKIGIIPLPIYAILVVLIAILTYLGEVKSDAPTMIAVLVLGGFTCAEIGKRLPVLRSIGAGAIFATFIPSALAYYKLLPPQIEKSIIDFTKFTNFLYIYIAAIIVGSILGMDRGVLIKGFLKIFVPLAVGSVVAGLVGTLVGTLLGLGPTTPSSSSLSRSWRGASARAQFRSPSATQGSSGSLREISSLRSCRRSCSAA